jgi:hypothetical protein
MISIIVYGRNDSHGYNMHKRVALSLNCMAAALSSGEDEIVYVDYNSPDDFPTLPEALSDTLTPETRSRLRVVRVRAIHHEPLRSQTHLPVVEAVARNVGVRYSNPSNRWILSTNTDMIFHAVNKGSLTEIVSGLDDGYYGIPRFEIPEGLWEGLDRYCPVMSIRRIAEWARKYSLREIVLGMKEIRFDAPGDFQLVPRDALFKIHGFNEQMLKGWHVDSNLCKRMGLLFGGLGDISAMVEGYHCSHTRVMTLNHRPLKIEDSFSKHIHEVTSPYLEDQAETWGLNGVTHEQIRLNQTTRGLDAILSAMSPSPRELPSEVAYVDETYDLIGYEVLHQLPFLADILANQDKSFPVAWIGRHRAMFDLFLESRRALGHSGPVMVSKEDSVLLGAIGQAEVVTLPLADIVEKGELMFFDFIGEDGLPISDSTPLEGHLVRAFYSVVDAEQLRLSSGRLSRRIVAINAIHNRFEGLVRSNLNTVLSPFTTRLRQGTVVPRNTDPQNWLENSQVGVAGERVESGITSILGKRGHVVYGPYASLSKGCYRVEFELESESEVPLSGLDEVLSKADRGDALVLLDVVSLQGKHVFAQLELKTSDRLGGSHELSFEITSEHCDSLLSNSLEARIFSFGHSQFAVTSVTLFHADANLSPRSLAPKSSKAAHRSEMIVTAVYRSLLQREPDKVGLTHYTQVVDTSGIDVCISAILGSEEFKTRLKK